MRAARWLGHLGFTILGGSALAFCVHVCVSSLALVGQPFVGFAHTDQGFVTPASMRVWDADRAGLRRWDRVVAVEGELVFSGPMLRAEAARRPIGAPVTYQVEGLDGSSRFVQIPLQRFEPSDIIKSHGSQAILSLFVVLIAVLLYVTRPGTKEAWSFFLFFASVGVAMASGVDVTLLWQLPPVWPHIGPFLGVAGLVLVGVITRAYVARTDDDLDGRLLRRTWWSLTFIGAVVAGALSFGLWTTAGDMPHHLWWDQLMLGWLGICTAISMAALVVAYRRGRSANQRARLKQIIWAWPVGAGIPTINLFFGSLLELTTLSLLWNGFVLLVPLSTADAIVRHDLLHLTGAARRLVGGITIAAVVGMGLGFVMWASVEFLELTEAAGMVALAALLFAVAAPVTHRVQRYVDNLLRSGPYDSGGLLAQFTAKASTAKHLAQLLSQLSQTLQESVVPGRFELYRLDADGQVLLPLLSGARSLEVDAPMDRLLDRTDPAIFDEEEPAPGPLRGAVFSLRLAVADEPVGLLVLGPRADGRPYEGGDAAFVSSLAGPLAAALVNTRAYQEIETLNRDLERRVVERTRELEQTNEELNDLNHRKDELVATVSHDFRSPLASIRQNVQTILRDLGEMEPNDLRYFLEGIARQEGRLSSMCENLLDLARLKETRAPQDKVDVRELVDGLMDGFAVRAEQAGVELEIESEEDAPAVVRGDPQRLGQVLQNLVDNAIKFTPSGGRVTVHLGATEDTAGGERLRIRVMDTGCGVPARALPRLFEPFFQVPSESHAGKGSGLGLAIVKAVVEAHRGSIHVDSHEGEGTTFTITLDTMVRGESDEEAEAAA
jgi:signal transduction histidine kinase